MAEIPNVQVGKTYTVKKGDCLWNVSKTTLKENGERITNKKILGEMARLANLNGYENSESFSRNFWKPGPGFQMKLQGDATTAPKPPVGKVTVEKVATPPKAPDVPAAAPIVTEAAKVTPQEPKAETPAPKAPEVPETSNAPAASQNVQEAPKPPSKEDWDISKTPFAVKPGYQATAGKTEPQAVPPKGADLQSIKDGIDAKIVTEAPKVTPEEPKAEIPAPKAPEVPETSNAPAASQNVQEAPKPPSKEAWDTSKTPFAVKPGYQAPAAKTEPAISKQGPTLGTIKNTIDAQIAKEVPAPKVEVPAPKVEVPAPKVEVPAPKVEVPAPKVEVPAPKVEVPAPKVEVPAPKVEEAPKKLTRPQDAKFGDNNFWSTNDKDYFMPDGKCYGKLKSGKTKDGDPIKNLYFDMDTKELQIIEKRSWLGRAFGGSEYKQTKFDDELSSDAMIDLDNERRAATGGR